MHDAIITEIRTPKPVFVTVITIAVVTILTVVTISEVVAVKEVITLFAVEAAL